MKHVFADMQREVHVLGPLLPISFGTEPQNTEEGASVDIETFLVEMLVQHGKRSVFFVRFFFVLLGYDQIKKFSGFLWQSFLAHNFRIY
jgi:hypothetical protein